MIIKLNEGISIINNQIIYNTDGDSENDIMNIVYPDIYNSEFLGKYILFWI